MTVHTHYMYTNFSTLGPGYMNTERILQDNLSVLRYITKSLGLVVEEEVLGMSSQSSKFIGFIVQR